MIIYQELQKIIGDPNLTEADRAIILDYVHIRCQDSNLPLHRPLTDSEEEREADAKILASAREKVAYLNLRTNAQTITPEDQAKLNDAFARVQSLARKSREYTESCDLNKHRDLLMLLVQLACRAGVRATKQDRIERKMLRYTRQYGSDTQSSVMLKYQARIKKLANEMQTLMKEREELVNKLVKEYEPSKS